MSYYAQRMHKVLTARAGDWLARHAWPHLTMVVAFALSFLAAYQCSIGIVNWGGFAIRFSINFLVGYAVYVLSLAIWLGTKSSLQSDDLLKGAPKTIETKNPWSDEAIEDRERFIEQTTESASRDALEDGAAGLLGAAIAILILGTLFVAAHLIWYARWYLGRLLILSGKIRHRTLMDAPPLNWLTAPLQVTGAAAVILLLHYALLGAILEWAFPGATTIADLAGKLRK